MAKKLKALRQYSPRVKQATPVPMSEFVGLIAMRTNLNKGIIKHMLSELHDCLLIYLRIGRPVKLDELGHFSTGMDKDGVLRVNFRPDKELINELNHEGMFDVGILNKNMLGKGLEDYIARWNEEHPDDPIEDE